MAYNDVPAIVYKSTVAVFFTEYVVVMDQAHPLGPAYPAAAYNYISYQLVLITTA